MFGNNEDTLRSVLTIAYFYDLEMRFLPPAEIIQRILEAKNVAAYNLTVLRSRYHYIYTAYAIRVV